MTKLAFIALLSVVAVANAGMPGSIRNFPGTIKGKLQNPEQLKADLKRWANFACDLKDQMASTTLDRKTKIAAPFVKAACGVTKFVGKMATNGKAAAGGLYSRGKAALGGLRERIRNREMIEPEDLVETTTAASADNGNLGVTPVTETEPEVSEISGKGNEAAAVAN